MAFMIQILNFFRFFKLIVSFPRRVISIREGESPSGYCCGGKVG